MTRPLDRPQLADALFEHASRRHIASAVRTLTDARRDGTDAATSLGALADVQREVGERWYAGEWDIADAHAATAVVDAALSALEVALGHRPGGRPTVVVACPEGEWHAMPARLLAADLRRHGADALFLGASVPAGALARYAVRQEADVVAMSVTTALALTAARAGIAAAIGAGIPVVVGGAAVAAAPSRAHALGADAHAVDATSLLEAARASASGPRPEVEQRGRGEKLLRMALDRDEVVRHAVEDVRSRLPEEVTDEHRIAQLAEGIDHLCRWAEAAHLLDDDSLIDDHIAWLAPMLQARRIPRAMLADAVRAVGDAATTAALRRAVVVAIRRLASLNDR